RIRPGRAGQRSRLTPPGRLARATCGWPSLLRRCAGMLAVLAGRDFSPGDVMGLLARIVRRPGVTGLDYRDERGPRCVTGQLREERYHVTLTVEHAGEWQIDLTLWLHDLHRNVTRWHEELRDRITAEERIAVLRIKDD